jgi:hypothetical protein
VVLLLQAVAPRKERLYPAYVTETADEHEKEESLI